MAVEKTAETRCFYTWRNWVCGGRGELASVTITWSCIFVDHNLQLSLNRALLKSIVQRILRGVKNKLKKICAGKLEARPFFFLNFKGTPSQEKQKTIFSGLMIFKVALSNQIDFPAFFTSPKDTGISSVPEYDNPPQPLPSKMALCCHVLEN